VVPAAVEALLASGQASEARAVVKQFARGLRDRDAPAAMAALRFCRGALASSENRPERAARAFAAAARVWSEAPFPYEAARAHERRGRALLTVGERLGADSLLGALEEFERLGATRDAGRVRRELSAREALPYPWRGGRRSYGEELSPRELEVAYLAAAGQTNRAIAETLVISPRTVEKHVASVRRKLAVPSRKELGSALASHSGG